MLGLGIALAIIADAVLVRFTLLPAIMTYLGRANWWWPRSEWTKKLGGGRRHGAEAAPPTTRMRSAERAFLYYALPWEITDGIIPFDWTRAVRLGDLFFWTLALGTAAWAFFRSAGEAASPAHSRFARRDGLLALASVWLALSYGCTLVEVFSVYFSGIGEDMVFYFDFTMVLRALGEVAVILGAVFAAVAFGRSRRSLTDLCASLPGAAPDPD